MMIPFTKVQAVGNDFVVVDAAAAPALSSRDNLIAIARFACDRARGVGADGLIVMSRAPGDRTDVIRMHIINADGSEGGICGNGARCIARLAAERGHASPDAAGRMTLVCGGRPMGVTLTPGPRGGWSTRVSIDMGVPALELARVPVRADQIEGSGPEHAVGGERGVFVSMGNPHMVIFADPSRDIAQDILDVGPRLERHPAFPERMNVHLARVIDRGRAEIRTWERGAGHTQGCGSGSCAVLVAGVVTERLGRRATIVQPGGEIEIEWQARTDHVMMTGETEIVSAGELEWTGASP